MAAVTGASLLSSIMHNLHAIPPDFINKCGYCSESMESFVVNGDDVRAIANEDADDDAETIEKIAAVFERMKHAGYCFKRTPISAVAHGICAGRVDPYLLLKSGKWPSIIVRLNSGGSDKALKAIIEDAIKGVEATKDSFRAVNGKPSAETDEKASKRAKR